MGYSLSFRKRTNRDQIIDGTQFQAFFETRHNYTESDLRFYDYENERNGVCFTISFARIDDGSIPRPDLNPDEDLADFSMSYAGVPSDVDEICRELEAFVKYFDLEFCDPQREGYGHYKPFSSRALKESLGESFNFAASVVDHLAAQGEQILIPEAPKKKGWWPF